ncbi:MAG: hypothetical protein JWO77_3669 [Ilumatobacteraceae bacterium]|nr:hypothetical protein [Ilumatobacteraceae bacterium]
MRPSSTSSSEPDGPRPVDATPGAVLGDAPADAAGGHPAARVRGRRNRSVVAWALVCTAVLFLVAEVGVRSLGTLPPNRTWPDVESQFKAEHAASVRAEGLREPLVFAGSSVSDAAFDPERVTEAAGLDVPSFNYAQEGSLASSTAMFLDAAVLDDVQPDIVVMGVYPGDIGAAPTNAASLVDELPRSRGYRRATGSQNLADRIEEAASSRSALVAHREILRNPYRLAQWLRSAPGPEFFDADTGALTRHRARSIDPALASPAPGGADPSPDDEAIGGVGHDTTVPIAPQVAAIEDLAARLAAQDRRLVVVELPVLDSAWDEASSPDGRERTHDELVGVERAGCAERLDLRSEIQDPQYWSDGVHVNAAGTAAISEAVGEWLADHPDPPADC